MSRAAFASSLAGSLLCVDDLAKLYRDEAARLLLLPLHRTCGENQTTTPWFDAGRDRRAT